jgi:hypothetical protein
MDGLIVFGAFELTQFNELLSSYVYHEFIKENTFNYIGQFNLEL